VARVNKSKLEMTRCGVASIFRCSRPLRLESSSFPLLPRTAATMAHVHTHEPHARTYIRSAIRKEHCEAQRRLSSPADPLCSQLGDPWLFTYIRDTLIDGATKIIVDKCEKRGPEEG